jgi:NAD(P)-dependent dehydrogenase (short-subunit alcohol dehydrogenase family)
MERDLAGKVVLVTGATSGVGKAASLELALRGASLTIVARNREKGERTQAEIRAAGGTVDLLVGDLSRMADVRAMARGFRAAHDRLDVLANNAGAFFQRHRQSDDGIEMTFAVNHLAYFLLTRELLPLLSETPGARVVNTASGAYVIGNVDFATIAKRPSGWAGFRAYADSKLCNVLFTRELAHRLPPGATANCFHPGFVRSGFAANNGRAAALFVRLLATFARSPERAARTLVWLAASPDAARYNGEYFHDEKPAPTSSRARDGDLAHRLWEFSEEICGAS